MKKYRNKNDIPYKKFIHFVNEIKGLETNEDFVAKKVISIFETNDFEGFNDALLLKAPLNLSFKIDMTFKTAGKFIDADNYMKNDEVLSFMKLVTKPKYWYSLPVNYDKISLGEVEYVVGLFTSAQLN